MWVRSRILSKFILHPSLLNTSLVIIFVLAVWLRLQTVQQLQGRFLFDTDPYRFLRMAEIILNEGSLPERDMARWLPHGRDLSIYLTLWPLLIAKSTLMLRFIIPSLSPYTVALYLPVAVFALTMFVTFLWVKNTWGREVAYLSLGFLAVMPSALARSVAGYADRDALCLFWGVTAIYCFSQRERAVTTIHQWTWMLLSLVATVSLGLTWEGVGLFIVLLVGVAILKFCIEPANQQFLWQFAVWCLGLLVALLVFTRAYRTVANVLSPFAVPALGAPSIYLMLMVLRFLVLRLPRLANAMTFSGRIPLHLSLIGMVFSVIASISLVLTFVANPFQNRLLSLWDNLSSPLGTSRLIASVSELRDMSFTRWAADFSGFYLLASAGALLLIYRLTREREWNPWVLMISFELIAVGVFYHSLSSSRFFNVVELMLYMAAFALASASLVYNLASRSPSYPTGSIPLNIDSICLVGWYGITLFLSRSAVRYTFFYSIPASILTAYSLRAMRRQLSEKAPFGPYVSGLISAVVVIGMLFFRPMGAYLRTSITLVHTARPHFSSQSWMDAFDWMREKLPQESVIAAAWPSGSSINFLGQRASPYFQQVYPPGSSNGNLRIWEIKYPSNLAHRPEYLDTDFRDPLLRASWMYNRTIKPPNND